MQSKARTVKEYLAELPPDRRAAIKAVRAVILKNLDNGIEEGMSYGMIGYCVPHRIYPAGYHCNPKQPLPYAGLASQKNHMSVYLSSVYEDGGEEKWLREQFRKAGRKLDMGKCCIRFKRLEDLPLDVIGRAIERFPIRKHIEHYEKSILPKNKRAAAKASASKAAAPAKPARKKAAKKRKKTAKR